MKKNKKMYKQGKNFGLCFKKLKKNENKQNTEQEETFTGTK